MLGVVNEMIKLYHIDRACLLHEGDKLELQNGFYIDNLQRQKCLDMASDFYNDGLSNHGVSYFLNGRLNGNYKRTGFSNRRNNSR